MKSIHINLPTKIKNLQNVSVTLNPCDQDLGIHVHSFKLKNSTTHTSKFNTETFKMEGISCKAYFKVLYKDTIGCGERIYLV